MFEMVIIFYFYCVYMFVSDGNTFNFSPVKLRNYKFMIQIAIYF